MSSVGGVVAPSDAVDCFAGCGVLMKFRSVDFMRCNVVSVEFFEAILVAGVSFFVDSGDVGFF